ncbi:MAG: hypothetical protein JWQ03_266 [Variovorax sp.]|nr:hypothetical protein [Variovorax sp.]
MKCLPACKAPAACATPGFATTAVVSAASPVAAPGGVTLAGVRGVYDHKDC